MSNPLPPKKIPLRRCCGCYEMKPKQALRRIVRAPNGTIAVDATGKANGRGAYLCRENPACLQKLRKKKGLQHTFKCPVPNEIYDALEREIAGCHEE
ncbi:MAG: YlxR family protein [Oscillospiraceae bacterium]|jgi:predicted RNA-binding protein YlxR (DUF448 family)|nr:YlxR family protein [Oscillospiraceae bacterium]